MTRNLKNKTRKIKGGYIEYKNERWVASLFTKDKKRVHPDVLRYNISEASFFNDLNVPGGINTGTWFSVPTNANRFLENLAPNILTDALTYSQFQEGISRMKKAISHLVLAHSQRKDHDQYINNLPQETKLELGITQETQDRHTTRTLHMENMIKEIDTFMIPYEEKRNELKPKPTPKSLKKPSRNPFLYFRRSEELEPEQEPDPRRAEEPRTEPDLQRVQDDRAERELKRSKQKSKRELRPDISDKYEVTTFNYNDFVEPTSLCVNENGKMCIFSKNLITLLNFHTGLTQMLTVENLGISCCYINDEEIFFTGNGTLNKLTISEDVQKFNIINDQKIYKGIDRFPNLGEETPTVCTANNKIYLLSESLLTDITPPNVNFNNPMGINYHKFLNMLVIADTGNHRIIIIQQDNPIMIVGGLQPGFKNGKSPKFNNPTNVYILYPGSIIVSDTGNHSIRIMKKKNDEWITETIAGNGTPGAENGIGDQARFNEPYGLYELDGVVYVADKNNNAIRMIENIRAKEWDLSIF